MKNNLNKDITNEQYLNQAPIFQNYFIICSVCKKFPLIELINKEAKISCNCLESEKMTFENIMNNYFYYIKNESEKESFIKENLMCLLHEKKFKSYCVTCKEDICDLCLSFHHNDHKLFLFYQHFLNFEVKNQSILDEYIIIIMK